MVDIDKALIIASDLFVAHFGPVIAEKLMLLIIGHTEETEQEFTIVYKWADNKREFCRVPVDKRTGAAVLFHLAIA